MLKELYVPGLRDYVKAHYALGPVWSTSGKVIAANRGGPPPPQPPSASLLNSGTTQSSSSRPKEGMAAVFAEINSGKPVTSGIYLSFSLTSLKKTVKYDSFVLLFACIMFMYLLQRFEKGH